MRKSDRSPLWGNKVKRCLRESLNYLTELKNRMPKISAKAAAVSVTAMTVCVAVVTVAVIGGKSTPVEAADIYIGTDASESEISGVGRFSVVTEDNTVTDMAPEELPENGEEDTESQSTGKPERYTVTFAFHSRDSISCSVDSETTVGELADKLGITFSDTDVLNIPEDQTISEDTVITTDKVTHATDTVHTAIPYTTKYVEDSSIYQGKSKTVQYGQNGESITEYEVTYVNGVEDSRTEVRSYVAKEPVEQIIHKGTKVYTPPKTEAPASKPVQSQTQSGGTSGGTFVGGDGKTYSYSKYIDVRATVYYTGGYCANGMPADENVIAVDPSVIPLGTKVYITGSYADVGVRIAADTGGSIKGNIIDICVDPSSPLAGSFGWRDMRVYFID